MRVLALALLALFATAGKSEAQTNASDLLQFYKGYLAVLAKAKNLDESLPYYTRELAAVSARCQRRCRRTISR